MQIHVTADRALPGHEATMRHVQAQIRHELVGLVGTINRVAVHIGDDANAPPGRGNHCCVIEARGATLTPVAAIHHAGTLRQAIEGAAEKIRRAVARAG